jgi:hypothetical protein
MASDVLNLKLPAPAEVTLNTGSPLHRIGRMELDGQHDVLGLREK